MFAADEQHAHPVEVFRWAGLARQVLDARGVKGEAEVSLLFVDEAAMAALNEQFLGKQRSDRRPVLSHRGRSDTGRPFARLRGHGPRDVARAGRR